MPPRSTADREFFEISRTGELSHFIPPMELEAREFRPLRVKCWGPVPTLACVHLPYATSGPPPVSLRAHR
jgi:hypothetical protein